MNKKIVVALVAVLILASGHLAEAQQPKKVPRIAYLSGSSASSQAPRLEAFRQGLRELGYIEGKNIAIEYRFAEGKLDRVPGLADELVRLKVDVIVVAGTGAAVPAKKATSTIPIVMANVDDPVKMGLVASFSKPGGNVTGLTQIDTELTGKRLELLNEAISGGTRLAVLLDPTSPESTQKLKATQAAAGVLGMQLQILEVRALEDLEPSFSTMKKERADGLIVLPSPKFNVRRRHITDFAAKNRLPAIYATSEWVDAGGLMSYAPNFNDLYRRAAIYVDKILKGAKPADLPVEAPMKFELVINLKAAKQIGLTIPQSVLYRADKVIK